MKSFSTSSNSLDEIKNHLINASWDDKVLINIDQNFDIEELIKLIEANEPILCDIQIRGQSVKGTHCYRIDEALWLHRSLAHTMTDKQHISSPFNSPVKRKRSRTLCTGPSIDVAHETNTSTETTIDTAVQTEVEERSVPSQKAISYDTFKTMIRRKPLLNLSDADIFQLWHRVLGSVFAYGKVDITEDKLELPSDFDYRSNNDRLCTPHLKFQGMSKQAAEMIIKHSSQFAYGVDLKHLPAGFILAPYSIDFSQKETIVYKVQRKNVLHFTPERISVKDEQAVVLVQKRQTEIPKKSFDAYCSKIKNAEKRKLIESAHKALTQSDTYHPAMLQAFRQLLPIMVHVKAKELSDLLSGPFDSNRFKDVKVNSYTNMPWNDKKTKDDFKKLSQTYSFNAYQIQSLWDIYATLGEQALKGVFEQLSTLKPHEKMYLTHVYDLSQLSKHQDAMMEYSALNEAEKHWWDVLITQHLAVVPHDDVALLQKCFARFCKSMRDEGLTFYQPVSFKGIRSLPVALSRMKQIMANCSEGDRRAQWSCITALPLQANGAIRAIEDSTPQQPCHFVTPEMRLTACYYYFVKGHINYAGYNCDTSNFPSSTSSELKTNPVIDDVVAKCDQDFMRHLAWSDNRSPLSFYLQALDMARPYYKKWVIFIPVKKEYAGTMSYLYVLSFLRDCSTGAINSTKVQLNQKQGLKLWREILELYQNIKGLAIVARPLKTLIRERTLETISRATYHQFYFDELLKTTQIIFRLLGKINPVTMALLAANKPTKSFIALWLLSSLDHPDGMPLMHDSFRFLDKLSDSNLWGFAKKLIQITHFLKYNNKMDDEKFDSMDATDLHRVISDLFDGSITRYDIIPLISQFNITPANILGIQERRLNGTMERYGLNLLRKMKHNKGLDVQKLITFIENVNRGEQTNKAVHDLLKRDFSDYFEPSFLDNLNADPIDVETIQGIKALFLHNQLQQDAFKRLLSIQCQKDRHQSILQKMSAVLAPMKEPGRSDLIDALIIEDIFEIQSAEAMLEILNLLVNNPNPNHWLYAIQSIQKSQIKGLVAKEMLALWLETICPLLSEINNKSLVAPASQDQFFNILSRALVQKDASLNDNESLKSFTRSYFDLLSNKPQSSPMLMSLFAKMMEQKYSLELMGRLIEWCKTQDDLSILSLSTWFYEHHLQHLEPSLNALKQNQQLDSQSLFDILTIQAQMDAPINEEAIGLLLNDQTLLTVNDVFQTPPYPALNDVAQWHQSKGGIDAGYQQFQKNPAPREPANGFDVEKANIQVEAIPQLKIDKKVIEAIKNAEHAAKGLDLADLKAAFKKAAAAHNAVKMTAYSAEILYRSMGRQGCSYEINTTQYLAVYALLSSPEHIMGEIVSGEGKTRVFMLLAACLWQQGKTVDFVTRNMALASRELVDFQRLFQFIGAKTTLITKDSDESAYEKGAIHFSDVSNLSLFRNIARSKHRSGMVNDESRALLLDEADQATFDAFDTNYNYATNSLEGDFSWLYPFILEFIQDSKNQALYYDDIDACNLACKQYIRRHASDEQFQHYQGIDEQYIEAWHDSAMLALSLEYQKDFIISANSAVNIPGTGVKKSSLAQVVKGNRVQAGANFANGTHQFLHARLNQLKAHPDQNPLSEAIKDCLHPFVILPEHKIIYSSTSKTFLDDYQSGVLIALTGTAGNSSERLEASHLYGKNHHDMTIVSFPRHNNSKQDHMPLQLTKNRHAQRCAIVNEIKKRQADEQPILIICENDQESEILFKALSAELVSSPLNRIHAGTSLEEEQTHTRYKAGQSRHITISTDMIGRGTNINLDQGAKEKGLAVICTYLPSAREQSQVFNRSGRYGAPGCSRLILDAQRLKKRHGLKRLPASFFTHTHQPEERLQDKLNKPSQLKRQIRWMIGDFQNDLQSFYYAHHKENKCEKWPEFFKQIGQIWEGVEQKMAAVMDKKKSTVDDIKPLLNDYGQSVSQLWSQFFPDISLTKDVNPKLPSIYNELKKIEFKPSSTKRSFFNTYEPAHDGFSARYTHYFTQTRAVLHGKRRLFANTRASLRGEGIIFANLRALLRQEISLSEYLFPVAENQTQDNMNLK